MSFGACPMHVSNAIDAPKGDNKSAKGKQLPKSTQALASISFISKLQNKNVFKSERNNTQCHPLPHLGMGTPHR